MLWPLLHWLAIHMGIENSPEGIWYNLWSGVGSDLGEITILAAVIGLFRKHNCHVRGCWRLGKFPLDGTPFIVCRKHHPDIPNSRPTHEQVLENYNGGNDAGQITGTVNKESESV